MCDTLINPVCLVGHLVGSVTSSVAGDVLGGIAQAINNGVIWIVKNTATLWTRIPSPDLSSEPAVAHLQQWILPITLAVAVGGVIAAGARMVIIRKANPLIDVTGGLLTLAAAALLGAVIPTLLLKAGDDWSAWILQVSTGGQFTQVLTQALTLGNDAAPAVIVIFGIVAIVFSIIQAALMLFRDAALIILAGVLPLAAAGSIAPMTRTWIRKTSSWMLALIFYKPAAAAVYATAFTLIGTGGSVETMLMGFVMLVLSVLALPALMKFFTWTTGAITASGGGGHLMGAATMGVVALGAMSARGGGSSAQDQAAFIDSRLGGPSGGWQSGPTGAGQGPNGGGASSPTGAAPPSTPMPASPPGSPASGSSGAGAARSSGAAAGPAGAAATMAAQAAAAGARQATGAMQPEDQA